MAIRDMDVAARRDRHPPMYAKLSAFAVRSFIVGVAGALWGFVHWLVGAGGVLGRPLVPAAVHGHHRRHGLHLGSFFGPPSSSCCRSS
jgi:hypothetical protein